MVYASNFVNDTVVYILCLSDRNKGHQQEQMNMVGTRIKIMWEEQLFDSPIDYIMLDLPAIEP